MNPTNNSPRLSGTPTPPTRSQSFRPPSRQSQSAQQNAAANVVRGQINSIYDGNSGENTPHTTPTPVQNKQPEIQQTQAQPQPKAQPQQQTLHTISAHLHRENRQRINKFLIRSKSKTIINRRLLPSNGVSITVPGKNTIRLITSGIM